MSFFYLDTSRNAEEREFEVSGTNQLAKRRAAYNKGFALRKALLGTSSTVNTEIPLNRYSFFEMLENELLPNTRVEMNFENESDGNLIWQVGANCRVVINRMQLYVPRITFNSDGQSSYMSQYLKNHKWTYLRENIERSNSSQQRAGHFRISSGISKPRHVFVFIYLDILPKILEQYNNTKHSSIKMTPLEASNKKNKGVVYFNLYGDTQASKNRSKFNIGDKVRISKYKRKVFDKSYTPNWTEEIFIIDKIEYTNPVTYKLKDLNDKEIKGSFYEAELLKAEQDVFRIDKVIKRDYKEKQALVKWKGYDNDFNSWIPLKDLKNI